MKRTQVKPLSEPADIYQVLSQLQIGQQVPPEVLIADYKNGDIPPWTVREIERSNCLILTVIDPTARRDATLFEPELVVAREVFTLPTKTLAGPFYMYHPGCIHARNMLADIRQHARQKSERMTFDESEEAA